MEAHSFDESVLPHQREEADNLDSTTTGTIHSENSNGIHITCSPAGKP